MSPLVKKGQRPGGRVLGFPAARQGSGAIPRGTPPVVVIDARQVSWLAGRRPCPAFPGYLPVALSDAGSPLTVAGAAPALRHAHRIPIFADDANRRNHTPHLVVNGALMSTSCVRIPFDPQRIRIAVAIRVAAAPCASSFGLWRRRHLREQEETLQRRTNSACDETGLPVRSDNIGGVEVLVAVLAQHKRGPIAYHVRRARSAVPAISTIDGSSRMKAPFRCRPSRRR